MTLADMLIFTWRNGEFKVPPLVIALIGFTYGTWWSRWKG